MSHDKKKSDPKRSSYETNVPSCLKDLVYVGILNRRADQAYNKSPLRLKRSPLKVPSSTCIQKAKGRAQSPANAEKRQVYRCKPKKCKKMRKKSCNLLDPIPALEKLKKAEVKHSATRCYCNQSVQSSPLRSFFYSTPQMVTNPKINSLHRLLSSTTTSIRRNRAKSIGPKPPKILPLVARETLTQKEYINLLSTPNKQAKCEKITKPRKYYKQQEPCSPALIRLSRPTKRHVFANWQAYQHFLPPETLNRFETIIQSSGTELEPKDARHYFKKLRSKQHSKERKCKDKSIKIKAKEKTLWLKEEIRETVDAIAQRFQMEPLHMLNFAEMLLSDEIISWLGRRKFVKIANRSTSNAYKRTIVQICDKVVTWMDKMQHSLEIQALNSKELLVADDIFSNDFLVEEESEAEEEEELGETDGEDGVVTELEDLFVLHLGEESGDDEGNFHEAFEEALYETGDYEN